MTFECRAYPLAEKRGFAIAGWRRDEGELVRRARALVEPLDQARARQQSPAKRGYGELGGQEGNRHPILLDEKATTAMDINPFSVS
jgi:hypothetical protein